VRASKFPVVGRERVAKFVRAFHTHFWNGVDITEADTNGQASVMLSKDGTTFAVITLVIGAQGIDQVLWMMNPHKLGAVTARAAV
jgi:RNA polymerase sigma-70 factor (ECF subfamily)